MISKRRKNNRIFTTLLCFLLILEAGFPMTAKAAGEASYEQYRSGSVTVTQSAREYLAIEISNEEELRTLAEQCVVDSWSVDKKVLLTEDIHLKENSDIMIPVFGGIFDGNGHSISGLRLEQNGSVVGLFRYIQEGARVQNLKVEGSILPEGSQSQVGGIAGINYGEILSCTFTGAVTGDNEVGGIAGINEVNGEIRNCTVNAYITGNHSTGGIVGNNNGTLNHCTNQGDVNTHSTEVSYELEDITMETLQDINSTSAISAHTDSGGIAGISAGKIYYCTNTGTIGYAHVGYNTGGIAGRLHQGYLQSCTNTGQVLGRKDVGGIVGQMEPFLEIQYLSNKLQEIDRETDVFLDLLDAAQKDIHTYGSQASALTREITGHLKNVRTAGSRLSGYGTDLWYIYNQELSGVSQDLKTLGTDWSSQTKMPDNSVSDKDFDEIFDTSVSGNNISRDELEDWWKEHENDMTVTPSADGESYRAALEKFGDNVTGRLDRMTQATSDRTGGISDDLKLLDGELEQAGDKMERLSDVLTESSDKSSDNVDALMNQGRVLRNLFSELRDDLFRYEGITIADTSDEAASRDIREMEAGSNVEADAGTAAEDGTDEFGTDAETYYDTTSFQQGKVTLCLNQGTVEADTNVGGIVGMVSTEYDFDPEDDLTFTGAESFNVEQTVKAVIRDSRNNGTIIGKKDYVGGIVGRAEFGAVISCESYGAVSSTDGSYVGGIAGASSYAVRSSYAMCGLSGKSNVGGIAGKGCDIFYSVSYTTQRLTGEKGGSIAGEVAEDGVLYGNRYVLTQQIEQGNEDTGFVSGGIDGIGYENAAIPCTYEELCAGEEVPDAFRSFTVTFLADGKKLAEYQCQYGDALTQDQIPAIPEQEGFYAVWPEWDSTFITGSRVLEAKYEKWIPALASAQQDDAGKPLVLAQGQFLPEQRLESEEQGNEYNIQLITSEDNSENEPDDSAGAYTWEKIRILCENPDKCLAEIRTEDGWQTAETEAMASYLAITLPDTTSTVRIRITTQEPDNNPILIGSICGIVVLLITVLLIKKQKARKMAKVQATADEPQTKINKRR